MLTVQQCHALAQEGRATEAFEAFERILGADPQDLAALGGRAGCLLALGRSRQAFDVFSHVCSTAPYPSSLRAVSAAILSLQYTLDVDDQAIHGITRELVAPLGLPDPVTPYGGPAQQPLRIGFISPDLSDHPVGLLLLPLLLFVDRTRIQPVLYATGGRDDATRVALRRFCEWHDLQTMSHDEQLRQLRNDRLDILIDLAGHTAGNSLPVFARRAAPLQVSWLGYFGTTGVPAMDGVLLDPWHAPPQAEKLFTEEVLRLPHIRWCYNPVAFAPPVAPSPANINGFVTFGSFNNTAKYNDAVFDAWARILAAVPSSRLILKWSTFADPHYCESVWTTFASRGITRDRVDLRQRSAHRDVLQQYADIDIALDPFPFTGGYTSCESLWMGVPVVTQYGERTVSRQGYALVSSLGRADWCQRWIAQDVDGYVRRAIDLAASTQVLAAIRAELRMVMKSSPLMNGRRFAQDFTKLLLSWHRRRTGGAAADPAC